MAEPKSKVLLVTGPDTQTLRAALENMLTGRFRLEVVKTADEVLARLRTPDIAIILVDLGKGESAAWHLFARLEKEVPDVPIVVVSADDDETMSARALRDGAQDHVVLSRMDSASLTRAFVFAIERHRMARERQAALERLRELERFKTQFINTAAHELNSPLTPVKLQLHLLRTAQPAPPFSPKQTHALDIMERNVDRLIGLINDVLEAARLQANRLVVRREPMDVHQIVLESVESFQAQAQRQGVTLVMESKPGLRVEADPDRLTQVLFNLLGNALKFTPPEGKVRVVTAREGGFVIVRVIDTGIGLRPEDYLKLFQPFSQTHDWTKGKYAGSGLGLYIAQGIVEQHGGRIWCDSPGPNKGSTFSFAIPVPKASDAARAVKTPETKPTKGSPWTILYFKCPTCASRDINMRILKNRYECRACHSEWR